MIAAAVLLTAALAAPPAEEVGRIASFEGPPAGYRLLRGGTTAERVLFLLPLRAGDIVTVLPGAPPLRLVVRGARREDEEVLVCARPAAGCSAAPSYTVQRPQATPPASGVGAWLAALGRFLSPEPEPQRLARMEVVRGGEEPAVAVLDRDRRLVAGRRPFALAWTGFAPPCTFTLAPAVDGAAPLVRQEVSGSALRTAPVELAPGAYRLELGCRRGTWSGLVVAVPPGQVPAPPPLDDAHLAPGQARAVEAAWLAARGWTFEAWLRLEAEATDEPVAARLRAALQAGQVPPAPRDPD